MEMRKRVISHYCKGNSISTVGEIFSRFHSNEQNIINCWGYDGRNKNNNRKGRPSILSVLCVCKRSIVRKVTKNPSTIVPKLAVEISKMLDRSINVETLRNVSCFVKQICMVEMLVGNRKFQRLIGKND